MACCGFFRAGGGFLAPLDVREIPGRRQGDGTEPARAGNPQVGDLAALDERDSGREIRQVGAGAGGQSARPGRRRLVRYEIGADEVPKSISHEHTFNEDTAQIPTIESTLMRLSEMVARRLRESHYKARTIQLKLRYSDFTTITRAHSLARPTQVDVEIFEEVRRCFARTGPRGGPCGCWVCRRRGSTKIPDRSVARSGTR